MILRRCVPAYDDIAISIWRAILNFVDFQAVIRRGRDCRIPICISGFLQAASQIDKPVDETDHRIAFAWSAGSGSAPHLFRNGGNGSDGVDFAFRELVQMDDQPASDEVCLGKAPDGIDLILKRGPGTAIEDSLKSLSRQIEAVGYPKMRFNALFSDIEKIYRVPVYSSLCNYGDSQARFELIFDPIESIMGRTLLSRALTPVPDADKTIVHRRQRSPLFPALSCDGRILLCEVDRTQGDGRPPFRFVREFEVENLWRMADVQVVTHDAIAGSADFSYATGFEEYQGLLRSVVDGPRYVGLKALVPRNEIVRIVLEAALQLEQMHSEGFVHGDFKPDHVLVTNSSVKVIDSGCNRIGEINYPATPAWAAPEQLLSQPIATQADQFPLGLMLLKLIGGNLRGLALRGESFRFGSFSVMYDPFIEIMSSESSSTGWADLIGRCLKFDPKERFPSMKALADELADLCSSAGLMGFLEIPLDFGLLEATPAQPVWKVQGPGENPVGPVTWLL